MATDPQFASAIAMGSATIGPVETNLTVPTQAVTVLTAGASGTKIEEIVVHGTTVTLVGPVVNGQIYLFLYDGATYYLFDVIPVTATTPSATVAPYRSSRYYLNLVLKAGWSLRASNSIAGNASLLKVIAFGGDF